jgi:hypothetical protein
MKTLLFVTALFGATAGAETRLVYPLQTGNVWVYRTTSLGRVETKTVTAPRAEKIGGADYIVLSGLFPQDTAVRMDGARLLTFDENGKQDLLWVDSASPKFSSTTDPCGPSDASLRAPATYDGPFGHFEDAIVVDYGPGKCADAGVTQDVFLSYIGLVRRTETTIAGPRTYDLVYASLGGTSQFTASGVEFGLTLDRKVYKTGDTILARLTLKTRAVDPVVLQFPTAQEYDVVIFTSDGKEIYRWSMGKLFAQGFHEIAVSGEKNWVIPVSPEQINGGSGLVPGSYVAEAYLTTANSDRAYQGRVSFTIE